MYIYIYIYLFFSIFHCIDFGKFPLIGGDNLIQCPKTGGCLKAYRNNTFFSYYYWYYYYHYHYCYRYYLPFSFRFYCFIAIKAYSIISFEIQFNLSIAQKV